MSMHVVSEDHIGAILDLTQRRDKHGLTLSLIKGLKQIVPRARVHVYELYDGLHNGAFSSSRIEHARMRDAMSNDKTARLLSSEPDFVKCILSQEVVRIAENPSACIRLILPMRGIIDVIGLVTVDCNGCDNENIFLMETMLQVWSSQIFLLDRNERDALTGLLNRLAFEEKLPQILGQKGQHARRQSDEHDGTKCLAMLDIDHFKEVNDKFGHLFGDEVLTFIGRAMNESFRYYDYLFRYGGEEFAIVLVDVDLATGLVVLDRFREKVANHIFPQIGKQTISIGVVEITTSELPVTLVDKADKSLYYAKKNGRNRVCAYQHLIESGKLQEVRPGDVELF